MKRGMLRLEGGLQSADEFASRIGILTADIQAQPLVWLDIDGERAYPAFRIADDGLLLA